MIYLIEITHEGKTIRQKVNAVHVRQAIRKTIHSKKTANIDYYTLSVLSMDGIIRVYAVKKEGSQHQLIPYKKEYLSKPEVIEVFAGNRSII